MSLPRVSIVKLMLIVGIAALNLAAVRILFLYNSEMLIGVAPIGLALQFGIFRLMRSRGRGRAFWVGFVVCGLTAMMAFVWVVRSPGVILVSSTGGYYKEYEPPMYSALCECRDVATERVLYPILNGLHVDPLAHRDSTLLRASFMGVNAVSWFLPQLFIALAGGLLTRPIGGRLGKSLVRDPLTPAASSPSVARS